jgi:RNA polymerase sigma-32 factor
MARETKGGVGRASPLNRRARCATFDTGAGGFLRMADGRKHDSLTTRRLDRDEERELLARLQRGDAAAGARLIAGHLRFVTHIAKRYRSYGQPLPDLVQEGAVGLMEALKRFNPDRDTRLSTYAMWWIRASIQDYVVRSRSLVRIGTTAAQKALFFHLRRIAGALSDGEPAAEEFARSLALRFNTSMVEVVALARRIARPDQSLDAPAAGQADGGARLIDGVRDERPTPEDIVLAQTEFRLWRERLARALAALPPRELMIIKRRFLAETAPSRAALARELGLSKERVRQIEMRALARLRRVIEAATGAAENLASAPG